MNADKNREITAPSVKNHPRNSAFRRLFCQPRKSVKSIFCVLVILLAIGVTMAESALAEPNSSQRGNAGTNVTNNSTLQQTTPDTTATFEYGSDSDRATDSATAIGEAASDRPDTGTPDTEAVGNNSSTGSGTGSEDEYLFPDYKDPANKEKPGFFAGLLQNIIDIIKYLFYFALVLGIGLLAIYGIKIFTTKYNTLAGGGQELMNILEVRHLAPGKVVCLVEVAGKVLILGLAGNNINLLSELTDTEQIEALKQAAAQKSEQIQPFQSYLNKLTGRTTGKPTKRPARSACRQDEDSVEEAAHWRDELHSTGKNIKKLLDDIKDQDLKTKGSKPADKRGRGEKDR